MKEIKIKFALSIVFVLITTIITFIYNEEVSVFTIFVFLFIFVYFVIDSLSVLLPSFNKYIPTMKQYKKFYNESKNFNSEKLLIIKKENNIKALITFVLYFGSICIIGVLYLYLDFFEAIHIYLIFLLINMGDYISTLYWCPFKNIILKNHCCYSCRIPNWDRLMKFSILIFVPNVFTITLFILGLIIFIIWETTHHLHPERFYSISNITLRCNSCNEILCKKKKE